MRHLRLTTTLTSVSLFLAVPAQGVFAEDPVGRISLGINLGASYLTMGDVNDEVNRGNRDLFSEPNWKPMEDLALGFSFRADLKAAVKDPFFISLGRGNIRGHTGVAFNRVIDVDASTTVYYGRLLWAIPWRPMENGRFFLGGGPLILRDMELEVAHEWDLIPKRPERRETLVMNGSGSGFQLDLAAEYLLSDHMTISLDTGYRWAKGDLDAWLLTVDNWETRPGQDPEPDNQQLFWESYLVGAFIADPGTRPADNSQRNFDGPPLDVVEPVQGLGLDFSGARIEVGFRIHFF